MISDAMLKFLDDKDEAERRIQIAAVIDEAVEKMKNLCKHPREIVEMLHDVADQFEDTYCKPEEN
jgi:hypothetical protein